MNWSEFESIWKDQELPIGSAAEVAGLKATFEPKRRKLARALFMRDIREAAAGLFVAGYFAYRGWQMGTAGWPIGLAAALMVGLAAFFILERFRTRRNRLGADAALLAKLDADIAELKHQRRLLLNVAGWYLLPCLLCIVIVRATVPGFRSQSALFVLGYTGLVAFVYWGIWALNRRAVRKFMEPRLAELEKLRRDLLSSN